MRLARGQQLILRCGGTDAARQDTPPEPVKECEAGHSRDPSNIRLLFAWRRARRVRARLPPTATPSSRCSHFGIARSLPPISSLDSGDFSGHGRGAGEVSRAWGEVAAGVRVIVSRARFGGPGLREPCTTDPVSRRVRGASDSGMDPGKSRNMPLQELLASRRPSPRHFSPVSGYPSFVQAPSLLDPLRRESVGSRRLCLEADVGDVPGRVPVSRCDRESRIPGVIPDYPGLSRIKTFDRPHLRAPAWYSKINSSRP